MDLKYESGRSEDNAGYDKDNQEDDSPDSQIWVKWVADHVLADSISTGQSQRNTDYISI